MPLSIKCSEWVMQTPTDWEAGEGEANRLGASAERHNAERKVESETADLKDWRFVWQKHERVEAAV